MTNSLNVWRVRYDSVFRSSSGMKEYANDKRGITALVLTEGESLADVRIAIQASMSNQTTLAALHSAEWLGQAPKP